VSFHDLDRLFLGAKIEGGALPPRTMRAFLGVCQQWQGIKTVSFSTD
jgi:hypothetical protein